jgi:phosphatidylinositol alpha-mannosyltransferase
VRVALVCPYAWDRPGGVQSHVRGLAAALRNRGHEVLVLAPGVSRRDAPDATLVGRAVPVPANGSVAPIAFGPLAAARLRRALREFAPDVVHAHEPLVPSLSLLATIAAAPAVGTFHASARSSFGYRAARPLLARVAARLAARTAVSDAARHLASRYFPGDYALTPNGVDAARFAGAAPLDLGEGRKILFLSRIERRKGLEVLVQAMARLRTPATLIVAGSGPEEAHCRRLAADHGVEARFMGYASEEDKPRLYRSVDVHCAPGLGGESFGIVLIEAMAAGTPVVCSDLPGFTDAVGDAALTVAPGEPGRLARALDEVLTDDVTARTLSEKGIARAGSFDWSRLVANVERVYESAA